MKWYLDALRKYAVFSGRARRREYWMFELWNSLIVFAIFVVAALAVPIAGPSLRWLAFMPAIYVLAMALPSLSSLVRRLHDTHHSGRWIFISLIPAIGGLILLALTIRDSDRGDNRYGPNPKMPRAEPGSAASLPTSAPTSAATGAPTAAPTGAEMGYLAPPLDLDR